MKTEIVDLTTRMHPYITCVHTYHIRIKTCKETTVRNSCLLKEKKRFEDFSNMMKTKYFIVHIVTLTQINLENWTQ